MQEHDPKTDFLSTLVAKACKSGADSADAIMFDSQTKNIDINYVQNIYREENAGLTF